MDTVYVAGDDDLGGVEELAPVLLGEALVVPAELPGFLSAPSNICAMSVSATAGGEIKTTTGAPPSGPHPLLSIMSARLAAPCAMSEAELPKRALRSLVPA